jgi:hypothetical protein
MNKADLRFPLTLPREFLVFSMHIQEKASSCWSQLRNQNCFVRIGTNGFKTYTQLYVDSFTSMQVIEEEEEEGIPNWSFLCPNIITNNTIAYWVGALGRR